MKIIEISIFTKRILKLLDDEEYRKLQNELIKNPNKGNLIRGSGGLRKIRWSIKGRGKSGGIRIIYYRSSADELIFM